MNISHESRSAPTASFYPWLVVALLWVVAFLNYLDRLMITTMRQSLGESIPMSDADFGLLMTAFLVVYGVLSPLGGYLGDRLGRTRVIVASLLVWSLVTALTAWAQNFQQLLIARALMGISEACYLPAGLALIADYHRGSTRSLATGIHTSGVYLGAMLGGVGGILAEQFSWQSAFLTFGGLGVAYALLLVGILRDAPRQPEPQPTAFSANDSLGLIPALLALLRQPAFLILLVIFALFSLVNWGILTWLPTYLSEDFQLGQGRAGIFATSSNQIGALVGIILGGLWADRWSRRNRRARLLVPCLGFVLGGPCIVLLATTNLLPIALLGVVLYGVGKSFGDANWMPILCQISDRRYRATGYGVMNLVACMVSGVTTYLGGAMKDAKIPLTTSFSLFALTFFVAGCLFLLIRPRPEVSNDE